MHKMFYMPWLLAACAVLPAVLPAQASPDKEKIVQRFVEEFVPLTPGKDQFPGSFTMGDDTKSAREKPAHKVTLAYAFQMAKFETTQELYEAVAGANPSRWKGPRNSVEMVTWAQARDFCKRVTAELRRLKAIGDDEVIRLPTEAEWEYACRAGTTSAYSFGDELAKLGDFAWFTGNAKGNDPPVGAKKANPWGLFDMHGYVWEWCLDAWQADYAKVPDNGAPVQLDDAKHRVIRGGAWTSDADECRSAFRRGVAAATEGPDVGFRCVRTKKAFD